MCLTVEMTPQIEVHSIPFSSVKFVLETLTEFAFALLFLFWFLSISIKSTHAQCKSKMKTKTFWQGFKVFEYLFILLIVPRQILTSWYQDHLWFPMDGINHNICHKVDDRLYNLLSRADLIYIEKSMRCVKQLALLYGNLIMMVYVKYKVSSLPQYIYWDGKLLASAVYFA